MIQAAEKRSYQAVYPTGKLRQLVCQGFLLGTADACGRWKTTIRDQRMIRKLTLSPTSFGGVF